MITTKTLKTYIAAGTTNAAGNTTTGAVLDHRTADGGLVTTKITYGATGPDLPPVMNAYTSGDGVAFKLLTSYVFPNPTTGGSGQSFEWPFRMPTHAMYSRVDIGGNTGQPITCEAFIQEHTTS